jgi:predicted HAD superfamily Cof-like phosphohydrolase
MNEIERQIREFHTYFRHPHPSWPTIQTDDEQIYGLRSTLHREELAELVEAVDLTMDVEDNRPRNVFNIVKEACDLIVVAGGTLVTYGWPLDEAFTEVHRSNMSKLGPYSQPIFREDRKILKGPNYQPADMQAVYARLIGQA